jgi:hypothetical protein
MPKWYGIVLQMAQAKREDLTRGLPRYWTLKLSSYSDGEVCKALIDYRGALFPDPDEIAEMIDDERERRADPKKFLPCNYCSNGWLYVGPHEVIRCSCYEQWKKRRSSGA